MEKTKEYKDEEREMFTKAMDEYEEYKRQRALKALFQKGTTGYDMDGYNFLVRGFLWFKTLVCLLLDSTGGCYLDPNTICILCYDERGDGDSGTNWDACWINTKLFSGWKVCLASDGT